MIETTDEYREAYRGSYVGYVSAEFDAPPVFSEALDVELSKRVRDIAFRYAALTRGELKSFPVLSEYVRHFKRFKKTYHVLLQLASAAEGKPIPRISPLTSIMLASELSTFVLSSGHDLDVVSTPLTFDVASADRSIHLLDGRTQTLKNGDILLRDRDTALAAVVYGQSVHGMITESSTRALFVAYGVPGVESDPLRAHLDDIAQLIGLAGGEATISGPEVVAVS